MCIRDSGNTETDENRGRHPGDIEKKTVKDLVFFYNWLKDRYHLPQVLMGHSYEMCIRDRVRRGVALGRLPRFFCPEVYLNYLKKYDTIVAVQV